MSSGGRLERYASILALLDAFGDLDVLVTWSKTKEGRPPAIRSPLAGPLAERARKEELKQKIAAAYGAFRAHMLLTRGPVDLRGPVRFHEARGKEPRGMLGRGSGYGTHTAEASNVAEWLYAWIVERSGIVNDRLKGKVRAKSVVRNWWVIADEWPLKPLGWKTIDRLKVAVIEEHEGAPEVGPPPADVLPKVYPATPDPVRAAVESVARRARYTIEAPPVGNGGPVDELFWVPGEPDERSVTKVGGLPYRPAGLPWPQSVGGKPLTFLAQINFAESLDLFARPLPGEILLLFVTDRDFFIPGSPASDPSVYYEWHVLGQSTLVTREELPKPSWKLAPYHALRHRTTSRGLAGEYPGLSQIGDLPSWIQYADSDDPDDDEYLAMTFLASIGPLHPVPAPWADRTPPGRPAGEPLRMQDAGCFYLHLEESSGQIYEEFQCY